MEMVQRIGIEGIMRLFIEFFHMLLLIDRVCEFSVSRGLEDFSHSYLIITIKCKNNYI